MLRFYNKDVCTNISLCCVLHTLPALLTVTPVPHKASICHGCLASESLLKHLHVFRALFDLRRVYIFRYTEVYAKFLILYLFLSSGGCVGRHLLSSVRRRELKGVFCAELPTIDKVYKWDIARCNIQSIKLAAICQNSGHHNTFLRI